MATVSFSQFSGGKPVETTQAPVTQQAPTRTGLEKTGDFLSSAFGGGKVGELIGTEAARGTFGKTIQRLLVGRELSTEEEAQVGKGPTALQVGADIGRAALTALPMFKPIGVAGSLLSKAGQLGALGAGTGALGAVSEGGDLGDIATSAGISGAVAAAIPVVGAAGSKAFDLAKKAVQGTKAVGTLVTDVARGASRIPANIATNVAEKQAFETAVKTLPTKTAQTAVRDGIEIAEAKQLYGIPAKQRAMIKPLVENVKKFVDGATKTNPIELVGKPIVNRLKVLESKAGQVGQKLGEASKKLGIVYKDDLIPAVTAKLRRVPGLAGIEVSPKGLLNFNKTTLATSLSTSDRTAIQEAFTNAVKQGSGNSKHLYRQELFEILGGKKKANLVLTDTQDKAFNAIRAGLSDVLESKNPVYKTLSNEYRTLRTPIEEMRKVMRAIPGADEDILDMSAGLLARRLTSNAASNPQLRNILRMMDKATKVKGKTAVSIETLQDVYNILERYYDIAGRTSLQGQMKAGLAEQGITGALVSGAKEFASQTPAVRRKAIESILSELFK